MWLRPALLWLWHRPSATAPIRPLPWESPYAMGVDLKRQKKKKELDGKIEGQREGELDIETQVK